MSNSLERSTHVKLGGQGAEACRSQRARGIVAVLQEANQSISDSLKQAQVNVKPLRILNRLVIIGLQELRDETGNSS